MLIGGTTGVGKSTLATMLAARLGINRVIATDVIRQVLRAFFTQEAMPTVHGSAFEVGGIAGYRDQAERVGTGIDAIVERAAAEGKPVVVEGVHVVPGGVHPRVRERCVLVEALRGRRRPGAAPRPLLAAPRLAPGRALPGPLRGDPAPPGPPLGARAVGAASRSSTTRASTSTLARLMELVLDAVRRGRLTARQPPRSLGFPAL